MLTWGLPEQSCVICWSTNKWPCREVGLTIGTHLAVHLACCCKAVCAIVYCLYPVKYVLFVWVILCFLGRLASLECILSLCLFLSLFSDRFRHKLGNVGRFRIVLWKNLYKSLLCPHLKYKSWCFHKYWDIFQGLDCWHTSTVIRCLSEIAFTSYNFKLSL